MHCFMKVSVIIINYNTFELTCKSIKRATENTHLCELEIVLVDNASTECNPNKFLEQFPNVKLIRSDQNVGFARGNVLGIEAACGEFIVLLNSDAFLLNPAIDLCAEFLSKNPKVGVVTGCLQYPEGRIQNNCQRFPSIWVWLFEMLRLQKVLPKGTGGKVLMGSFFSYQELAFPDWVWGTFFMFRKSDLRLLPTQNLATDFFMYGEDMQWCWEFRKAGFLIAFLPEAKIEHLMGASGAAKSAMITENMNRFLEKYYPVWHKKALKLAGVI